MNILCCQTVCLGVCLYSINVKTAEPIGPKVCVGPYMTPGCFIDAQNYNKLFPKTFDFSKILQIHEKIVNSQKNFTASSMRK